MKIIFLKRKIVPLLIGGIFFLSTLNSFGEENLKKVPKGILLWDADSFSQLEDRKEVAAICDKIKMARIPAIALEVKKENGLVAFDLSSFDNFEKKTKFDVISTSLKEARKRGIQVFALFNVFSNGDKKDKSGPLFRDPIQSEWASVEHILIDGTSTIAPTTAFGIGENSPAFSNPVLKEVQDREISLVKIFLKNYPEVDGILFANAGFGGITSDFSEQSLKSFGDEVGAATKFLPQKFFGKVLKKDANVFPENDYLMMKWRNWRSKKITEFKTELVKQIREMSPDILVGDLVDAFPMCLDQNGVNWTNKDHFVNHTSLRETNPGVPHGDLFDFVSVSLSSLLDSTELLNKEESGQIELACMLALKYSQPQTSLIINMDLPNLGGRKKGFLWTLEMGKRYTQGTLLPSLSEVEEKDLWPELARFFGGKPAFFE